MTKWYEPYDSPEEAYVSWYLDEPVEGGYVEDYVPQPKSLLLSGRKTYIWGKELKTKTKKGVSTLLQEHVYTPDFQVKWTSPQSWLLTKSVSWARCITSLSESLYVEKSPPFWTSDMDEAEQYLGFHESYWEVKPSYDQHNMKRLFTINQKWLYDKYGIYVQKIIPQKLFEATFTPKRYLLTDKGKQKRKIIFATRTLEEYVRSRTK